MAEGRLRGVTYDNGKIFAVHIMDTDDVVKVFEPVWHGRWDKPIEHGLPYKANHLGVVCSYCCSWADNKYNYCPNCGAKIDGDGNDG